MANNCDFVARIVGKKDSVKQFANAIQYKDAKDGYCFARIFESFVLDEYEDDDRYIIELGGDCAWSVHSCFMDGGYTSSDAPDFLKPVEYNTNNIKYFTYVTAEWLCKKLGVKFEAWSREPGECFQEHMGVDEDGVRVIEECVDWTEGYDEDENGDWLDYNPAKDTGGFADYGKWYLN